MRKLISDLAYYLLLPLILLWEWLGGDGSTRNNASDWGE